MPLHIEAPETPEPTSEMDEFKLQVVKVADKYGRANNMCGILDEALKELDLSRDMLGKQAGLMRVQAEVMVPASIILEIDPNEFAGKSAEEQNKLLQGKLRKVVGDLEGRLNPVTPTSRVYPVIASDLKKITVTDVNELHVPSAHVASYTIPQSLFGYYTSEEGRVMHLERRANYSARGGIYGLCGQGSVWGRPTLESPRAEGRVCKRCESIAASETPRS